MVERQGEVPAMRHFFLGLGPGMYLGMLLASLSQVEPNHETPPPPPIIERQDYAPIEDWEWIEL